MNDMILHLGGHSIDMLLFRNGHHKPFRTKVVSTTNGRLEVLHPMSMRKEFAVLSGDHLVVTAHHKSYGLAKFSCTVGESDDNLVLALKLSGEVRPFNRRACYRVHTSVAAHTLDENPTTCELTDISEVGLQLQSRKAYIEGAVLPLRFKLPTQLEHTEASVKIVRVTIKNKKLFEYGCVFVEQPQLTHCIMTLQQRELRRRR